MKESVAVAKAWVSVSEDPMVGTDQTEMGLWSRVISAYEELKLAGTAYRNEDQLHKKWKMIRTPVRRFIGIHENNLKNAESGKSEADIKRLSYEMFRDGNFSNSTAGMNISFSESLQNSGSTVRRMMIRCHSGRNSQQPGTTAVAVAVAVAPTLSTSTKRSRRNPPLHIPTADVHKASKLLFETREPVLQLLDPAWECLLRRAEILSASLTAHHKKNLIEASALYRSETDPLLRTMYEGLIIQLCGHLGFPPPSPASIRRRRRRLLGMMILRRIPGMILRSEPMVFL